MGILANSRVRPIFCSERVIFDGQSGEKSDITSRKKMADHLASFLFCTVCKLLD